MTRNGCTLVLGLVLAALVVGTTFGASPASAAVHKKARPLIGTWKWQDLDESLSRGKAVRVRFLARKGRLYARFGSSKPVRVKFRARGRVVRVVATRPTTTRSPRRVRVVYLGRLRRSSGSWKLRGNISIRARNLRGRSAFTAVKREPGARRRVVAVS